MKGSTEHLHMFTVQSQDWDSLATCPNPGAVLILAPLTLTGLFLFSPTCLCRAMGTHLQRMLACATHGFGLGGLKHLKKYWSHGVWILQNKAVFVTASC